MHVPAHADHAQHDLLLIAGHAAGDLVASDAAAAERLLASCHDCAAIRRDLVALAAATRSLPAPATPTRDFRLTADQAAGLRRGSWLRTLLRPFAAPASGLRPMAAAFSSLGIAGLVVATVLAGFGGTAASAPSMEGMYTGQGPAASSGGVGADRNLGGGPTAAPQQGSGDYTVIEPRVSGGPPVVAGEGKSDATATARPPVALGAGQPTEPSRDNSSAEDLTRASTRGPSLLALASLGLLAVGLALFGLRFAARRVH